MTAVATILDFTETAISENINLSDNEVTLPEHPLVLSCTSYRLAQDPANSYAYLSVDATRLAKQVTDEDRAFAEELRRDFGQKLTYFGLMVGPLSKFKQALHYFLNTNFRTGINQYTVSDKYIAMAFKLPYFYEYNNGQLKFFDDLHKKVNNGPAFAGEVEVTYLGTLIPGTRRTRGKIEYWYKDRNNNRIVVELERKNPLLTLLDHMSDKTLTIQGAFYRRTNYSVEYYMAKNWKFS